MIFIDATTKKLQIKLPGAVTTNQLPWSTSYVDTTISSMTVTAEGSQDGVTNGGTAVDVMSSPGSGVTRQLKSFVINNADTVAQTLTIIYNDNATLRNIFIATLAVGDQLVYEDANGFSVFDLNGSQKKTDVVVGNVGSGSTDSGNPVKVGGVYNSTQPTFTTGQRGDFQIGTRGSLNVSIFDTNGTSGAAVTNTPSGSTADSVNGLVINSRTLGWSGSTWTQVTLGQASADGVAANKNGFFVNSQNFDYNGATFDRHRTPNTFKTASTSATGNTAVWTPTSGKKFRLMKFKIYITEDSTISGGARETIQLRDGASTSINLDHIVWVPTTASPVDASSYDSGWLDLGNGYLSTAANNVLNMNLSSALNTGLCGVIACGTEE